MKLFQAVMLLSGSLALLPLSAQAAPKAKISPSQADSAAKMKIPGKVIKTTYEFEDGHWQYAVLITNKSGQMYEAEVSSVTGKVTATEKTSATEEASEAAADKKAATKAHK